MATKRKKKGDLVEPIKPAQGTTPLEQELVEGEVQESLEELGKDGITIADNSFEQYQVDSSASDIGNFDTKKILGIPFTNLQEYGFTPNSKEGMYLPEEPGVATLYVPYGNVYERPVLAQDFKWGFFDTLILMPQLEDSSLDLRPAATLVSSPYPFGPEDEIAIAVDLVSGLLYSLLPAGLLDLTARLESGTLEVTSGYVFYRHDDDAPWIAIASDFVSGTLEVTTAYVLYKLVDPGLNIASDFEAGTLEVTAAYRTYLHDDDPGLGISCDFVGGTLT
jgi:hypothetical protein